MKFNSFLTIPILLTILNSTAQASSCCPTRDLAGQPDPRVLELIANGGGSMEEIAAIRGPLIHSPDQAIKELKQGNARFFSGQTIRPEIPVNLRRVQILAQTPFSVVLGCSDSRVPTELVYDQGLGSIFTIRNAGNIADPGALGSIEYAVKHLKPQVVVVMGHEGCGAVHGSMLSHADRAKEPENLQKVFNQILPAVSDLPAIRDRKARMREAVVSNVRLQVSRVNEDPVVKAAVASKKIRVIGAFYEITSGVVEFLDTPEELKLH
jgi:carbonic anhydrase